LNYKALLKDKKQRVVKLENTEIGASDTVNIETFDTEEI